MDPVLRNNSFYSNSIGIAHKTSQFHLTSAVREFKTPWWTTDRLSFACNFSFAVAIVISYSRSLSHAGRRGALKCRFSLPWWTGKKRQYNDAQVENQGCSSASSEFYILQRTVSFSEEVLLSFSPHNWLTVSSLTFFFSIMQSWNFCCSFWGPKWKSTKMESYKIRASPTKRERRTKGFGWRFVLKFPSPFTQSIVAPFHSIATP